MELRTYAECMDWVNAVLNPTNLPDGCRLAPNHESRAGRFTLHDVDPAAISRIYQDHSAQRHANVRTEGTEGGEYYYVYVTLPYLRDGLTLREVGAVKGIGKDFCFFYRKKSGRERREAYAYV